MVEVESIIIGLTCKFSSPGWTIQI